MQVLDHVHNISAGGKCEDPKCDFVFKAMRYCVEVSVYDNETQKLLVNEGVGTNTLDGVETIIEESLNTIKALNP